MTLHGLFSRLTKPVVTAINGTPLNDPGQALQLLQSLSTASSLNLAVERNGATQSVNLSLNP